MPEGALNRTASAISDLVERVLREQSGVRPAVTLSWAQSADGAVGREDGPRVILSSLESMIVTHRLRSLHAAILVGIGTVLADDPLLTVRLVPGPSPQPVVLDSALRFPDSARLLARTDHAPWIFHALGAPSRRVHELAEKGARLFPLSPGVDGLPLDEVLRVLKDNGAASVMVEGGARVLRSFMARRLADQAAITVSPLTLEGLRIFDGLPTPGDLPGFREMFRQECGVDTIVWGRFDSGGRSESRRR
jgi:GTP cyclohydrolase II